MRTYAAAGITKAALAGLTALLAIATAQAQEWRTSSSLIDPATELQTFQRYSYVNPDAPKGGTLNQTSFGTYDSFNPFIVRGTVASGLTLFGGYLWETLTQQSLEDSGTSQMLIAEAFKYPDDYSSATYRLNPNARWHDGEPITAADVVWSLETLKKISPMHGQYFTNVTEAVATSDHEVVFHFNQTGNRELPHIMGDLPILPKHWWEGTRNDGTKRDISQPTLETPLGSGPYRIGKFSPGSAITWDRVADYWGENLPVNIGRNNFDHIRITYFQDDNAEFIAFKKGGIEDLRREVSTRRWVTEYDFPAAVDGRVIKREFISGTAQPMQAFVFNMREPRFADPRVREALTYAYNFEDQNRKHFFGLNKRLSSYFQNSDLASSGLPEGEELKILEPFRDQLPPELFTKEFKLPVFDGPNAERQNLREASQLLREAGWITKGGRLINETSGEQFRIEFLGTGETAETITDGLIPNLRRLGIDATLRIVDVSQYVQRVQNFDFDAVTGGFVQSSSPGNEQREYWGSKAADIPGSRNIASIKNPVVDALIEKIIYAENREELLATTHALDRVLLWNYYTIPQYYQPAMRYAFWNKFGIPEQQPAYIGIDTDSWWIKPEFAN